MMASKAFCEVQQKRKLVAVKLLMGEEEVLKIHVTGYIYYWKK